MCVYEGHRCKCLTTRSIAALREEKWGSMDSTQVTNIIFCKWLHRPQDLEHVWQKPVPTLHLQRLHFQLNTCFSESVRLLFQHGDAFALETI